MERVSGLEQAAMPSERGKTWWNGKIGGRPGCGERKRSQEGEGQEGIRGSVARERKVAVEGIQFPTA